MIILGTHLKDKDIVELLRGKQMIVETTLPSNSAFRDRSYEGRLDGIGWCGTTKKPVGIYIRNSHDGIDISIANITRVIVEKNLSLSQQIILALLTEDIK